MLPYRRWFAAKGLRFARSASWRRVAVALLCAPVAIVFQAHLIMQSMSKLSASKLAVVEMSAAGGGPPRMEVRSTQHSLSSESDAQHFT